MTVDATHGHRRRKQTPWTVKFVDALASKLIAVGGIGTIAAIMLVVLVLLATASPLLIPASVGKWKTIDAGKYLDLVMDEHQLLACGIEGSGTLQVVSLHDGAVIADHPSPATQADERRVTAWHMAIDRSQLVLGFSDGSFQKTNLEFRKELLNAKDTPVEVQVNPERPMQAFDGSLYEWFDETSIRKTTFLPPSWSPPKSLGEAPIKALDYSPSNTESVLAATVGDELVVATITRKKALIGNRFTETVAVERSALPSRDAAGVLGLAILNNNSQLVAVWANGTLDRFSLGDGAPRFVETASGLMDVGRMTAVAPLLARQTLLCGDNRGNVTGWNVVRYSDAQRTVLTESESDEFRLVPAHRMNCGNQPVRAISSSQRNHVANITDEQGHISIFFVTTDDKRAASYCPLGKDARLSILDPGDDTILVASEGKLSVAPLHMPHPEASWATYFSKVWYEGYSEPQYIWQSSAGTERAESKLSLMPLVFGTLKATVFAMLVSVPLALMAAIYTSEFLTPSMRTRIKPCVELMASLPSVVLGFVAALVIAPLLQKNLMAVLLLLMALPLAFVLAGHLWNLMSLETIARFQQLRLVGILACMPIAVAFAWMTAPAVERWLFDGDLVGWLNGGEGSRASGWMLLLTPVLSLVAALISMGPLAHWTRRVAVAKSPRVFAIFSLCRLLATAAVVVASAWVLGNLLGYIGLDTRQGFFESYQDRNALLVGIALGFCVIPIIYTISDDALQSVPKQLRSASLGCGATPWQTTIRVVVPSAMSGLFSAIMVGLGRAVGETMVVLMAAGNTPVMQWNPFNGFRTLSATLATELPEAAKGSTHFRTLFLAALLLFMLTLVANTIAEFVRIRFRKRSSQL